MSEPRVIEQPVAGFLEMPHARFDWNGDVPAEEAAGRSLHLAIGIFDGVHLGHRAVIDSALACARSSQGLTGVLTFDPHPSRLLRPQEPTLLFMPPAQKSRMLRQIGVDVVIWKAFDRDFAGIAAESFLAELKAQLPTLRSVHIGENFRFGRKRAGSVDLLIESGARLEPCIDVFSVDRVRFNGHPISSSRIREELLAGRIAEVNRMLGYSYASAGEVRKGASIGRKLGFPTLNMEWAPELKPRFGVYCTRVRETGGGRLLPAVANYGVRPSVSESAEPVLEVHLLEACPDHWGEGTRLHVQWLKFLRPELRFPDSASLRARISEDVVEARAWFAR